MVPNATGTYVLSGSSVLTADQEIIGYDGTGVFTQSGGTNLIGAAGGLLLTIDPGSLEPTTLMAVCLSCPAL